MSNANNLSLLIDAHAMKRWLCPNGDKETYLIQFLIKLVKRKMVPWRSPCGEAASI